MVKLTQTIRRLMPTNCLSVFDHFAGLVVKGLLTFQKIFRKLLDCIRLNMVYAEAIVGRCSMKELP